MPAACFFAFIVARRPGQNSIKHFGQNAEKLGIIPGFSGFAILFYF